MNPLRTRLRKIKQRLSQIEFKRPRTEFTHLVQLPPEETELTEPIGNIGMNEDEVELDDEESYLFPRETVNIYALLVVIFLVSEYLLLFIVTSPIPMTFEALERQGRDNFQELGGHLPLGTLGIW